MDTNVVPLGERILRSVLDHIVANSDAAESSYLEAKRTVDITSKPGLVKVAKFVLACANRLPEDEARQWRTDQDDYVLVARDLRPPPCA